MRPTMSYIYIGLLFVFVWRVTPRVGYKWTFPKSSINPSANNVKMSSIIMMLVVDINNSITHTTINLVQFPGTKRTYTPWFVSPPALVPADLTCYHLYGQCFTSRSVLVINENISHKTSLDSEILKDIGSVSDLSFLSKLIEKFVSPKRECHTQNNSNH